MVKLVTCPKFKEFSSIRHGFFTRKGGVSKGIFEGLNVGYGSHDDLELVSQNRQLAMQAFQTTEERLCTLYQVHSSKAMAVTQPWPRDAKPEADGLASTARGLVLGILTADCAPLLFADPVNHVVGAAHAGWKGAGLGVAQQTVGEMLKLGAQTQHIHAVIGPCIQQDSYEVGPEFMDTFLKCSPDDEIFFKPSKNAGKLMFNLPAYLVKKLNELQLASVSNVGMDTCSDEEHFYSYRRKTLRGEADYGRQLSAIMLV